MPPVIGLGSQNWKRNFLRVMPCSLHAAPPSAPPSCRGPGVVGEQPILLPGKSYEYTSGCALTTPQVRREVVHTSPK